MPFLYISPSELAARSTEMKQEASDNIMSIFFSLFLLQHKHRLLWTAEKSAWGAFHFLQRKAANQDSSSPPFSPYYRSCSPGTFSSSLSCCLYFHCGLVWSTKHRGRSLALHQSYVIIPLPSPEFNITRRVSATPTDNTHAINRSWWQKAILSIVRLFKTLNSSQQRSCSVLKDLKK